MNIEKAIIERWAAAPALAALLPSERLTTGCSACAAPPYATIEPVASRPMLPTNAGNAIQRSVWRIHVWHADYDALRAIAEQVETVMDRAELARPGGLPPARLQRIGSTTTQHDDGLWQWTVELQITMVFNP